jgi:glycosyltransferase involved in cell wall biosynthesis
VLAVNSGGPSEFVEDGRTGVLARSGSPEDLADALERIIASPELRAEIGRQGQERFMAEYTTAALRGRFFARLEEIVKDR